MGYDGDARRKIAALEGAVNDLRRLVITIGTMTLIMGVIFFIAAIRR